METSRDDDLRRRILLVLAKAGEPVQPRYIQARHGVRGTTPDDFWRVLTGLITDGDIWSEAGLLSLNGTPDIPAPTRYVRHELPESASLGIRRNG